MVKTICICGAGTMGRGIAQVSAQAGFRTILYELNESVLDEAKISLKKQLSSLVAKGKLAAGIDLEILSRIEYTTSISDCHADFVIEAIVEKLDVKLNLFADLLRNNNSDCILASNTSSLSITEIANGIANPERVIGMHFFNPAPVMKLVEIVKTNMTSNAVLNTTVDLAKKMGKTPVICRDSPGFIVNRVARPFYIESLRLIEEEATDLETIDSILESTGFKMGPFKLMDLIGNDVNFAVSNSVYEQLNKPERLKPSSLQEMKVKKGELGKKSGEGYYGYSRE